MLIELLNLPFDLPWTWYRLLILFSAGIISYGLIIYFNKLIFKDLIGKLLVRRIVLVVLFLLIIIGDIFLIVQSVQSFDYGLTIKVDDVKSPMADNFLHDVYATNPLFLDKLRLADYGDSYTSHLLFDVFNENATGVYVEFTRAIYIEPCEFSKYVWLHELGHHVWFNLISSEDRNEWRRLHDSEIKLYDAYKINSSLTFPKVGFPTEYSLVNAEEDFAESFAYYGLNNKWDNDVKRKNLLIKIIAAVGDCEGSSSCLNR